MTAMTLQLDSGTLGRIETAAAELGMSVSAWVTHHLLRAAEAYDDVSAPAKEPEPILSVETLRELL